MCARRFLTAVFILTLLVVAAGFALYQWGGNVLLRSATPTGHFQASAAGGAPDYNQASNWIARPDFADDPSRWQPANGRQPDPIATAARIFYIHPTTYLERDRWNAPLMPAGQTEFRTRLFAQSQASAFNRIGAIWAPRYRQAAYGAFLLDNADARNALDLAYQDVAAAFDRFVTENPEGPIILVGHSQGALHLERLLREEIAGKPVAKRVVAAYVVGWPISTTADLPALGFPACRTPEQTGCILSWMSFGQPANPDLVLNSYEKSAGFLGKSRKREDVLCVNPLTGTQNGAAPLAANGGTLVPSANMTSASLVPGQVGAHCDKGLLLLDGQVPPLGPFVLPGNNYHVYDFALFWGSIRNDAATRLAAWNNDHHQ
jgi:hypothetical protein